MPKKKITELIVGTNNRGKLKEIKDLLPNYLKIYSPLDYKIKSPAENGKTFAENSLIKAIGSKTVSSSYSKVGKIRYSFKKLLIR